MIPAPSFVWRRILVIQKRIGRGKTKKMGLREKEKDTKGKIEAMVFAYCQQTHINACMDI